MMKTTIFVVLLGLLFFGCATTDLPPVTSADFAFQEDEKRLWLRAEEEQKILNRSGLIYEDKELEAYLNNISLKLVSPDEEEHIPFEIKIISNHFLNAFAYPNGVIYVHTGMLARMENEAQVATVLAHEMTHCTHRHMVKQFRTIKNATAFLATVQVTLGGVGGYVGDIGTLLGALGTIGAVTGYSQAHEKEADMEGIKRLERAEYDISEAPKLFYHLKEHLEEEDIKEPFFFGTHPRLNERIENYEAYLKDKDQGGVGGIKNAEFFKQVTYEVKLHNVELDLKAGRFIAAERCCKECLNVQMDDHRVHYLLGEIYRQRGEEGDTQRALDHYREAISITPDYAESHRGIGLLLYRESEKQAAKEHLETYLYLHPDALDRAFLEQYLKDCRGEEQTQ
jgi:predicted Zn-dependent protease